MAVVANVVYDGPRERTFAAEPKVKAEAEEQLSEGSGCSTAQSQAIGQC